MAVSLFLFTTLQTALRELTRPPTSEDAALRIVVRHKVSIANVLPGVAHCMKLTWFGGVYQEKSNMFPQFAVDPEKLFDVFAEARVDPQQQRAFLRERTACVVGIKTMNRFGWKLGDRITLLGELWPVDLELVIRGVYREGIDETNLFFHHEYFDEMMGDQGLVGCYWLTATSKEAIPPLIERADRSHVS